MTKTENKYKLMCVGSQLYSVNIFEKEAKMFGVQRAAPFFLLKTLKFGDQILLASYTRATKDPKKREGLGEIFAYFTLNGLSHNLPPDLCHKLYEKLNIVSISLGGGRIGRVCGSYEIGSTAMITDTLEELIQKIKVLQEEGEIATPNHFKWFITGKYVPLTPFIIKPITFARGIKTIAIKNLNLRRQRVTQASLVWLYNYRRRTYMPTLMKERFNLWETDFNVSDWHKE